MLHKLMVALASDASAALCFVALILVTLLIVEGFVAFEVERYEIF